MALVLPYIEMNLPQVYMCSPSWTLLPPPSPYHPSGSSHCTSPKHPVSCIEPGLVTHFIYDIIHISILPNHPTLSLSHRVQKAGLYISVSFAVSYTGFHFIPLHYSVVHFRSVKTRTEPKHFILSLILPPSHLHKSVWPGKGYFFRHIYPSYQTETYWDEDLMASRSQINSVNCV